MTDAAWSLLNQESMAGWSRLNEIDLVKPQDSVLGFEGMCFLKLFWRNCSFELWLRVSVFGFSLAGLIAPGSALAVSMGSMASMGQSSTPNSNGRAAAVVSAAPTPAANQILDLPTQDRWYERANENIALQTVYIDNRQRDVDQLLTEGHDSSGHDDVLRYAQQETGEFCQDVTEEDAATECLKQYQLVQKQYLQWLKDSLIQNQDSVGRLRTNVVVAPTGGSSQHAAVASSGKKKRLLPVWQKTIPAGKALLLRAPPSELTFDQMKGQLAGLQAPTAAQRSQWLVDFQKPLNQSEFPLTERVLTNEGQATGPSMQLVIRDAKGKPVFDTKAYNEALGKFFGKGGQAAHNKYLAKRVSMIQKIHQNQKAGHNPHATWKDHATPDQLVKYCRARQELANAFKPALNSAGPNQSRPGFHDKSNGVGTAQQLAQSTKVNSFADCVKENAPIIPVQGTIEVPAGRGRSPSGAQADETDSVYMSSQVIDQVMSSDFSKSIGP